MKKALPKSGRTALVGEFELSILILPQEIMVCKEERLSHKK